MNPFKPTAAVAAAFFVAQAEPVQAGTNPFVGEIMITGLSFCPRGWAKADGQLLPIVQNEALFSLFGTTYGGDGRQTFGLPDLRGRVPVHAGRSGGAPQKALGQKGGSASHTLSVQEMPSHSHALTATLNASDQPADIGAPNGANLANFGRTAQYSNTPANAAMASDAITVTSEAVGGGAAFGIEQPFLALNFCVALQGVFPSRN